MSQDTFPRSLQESILAALLFDAAFGSAIAMQVRVEHFDDRYRAIAAKALAYRKKWSRPPGQSHVDDIFTAELTGKDASAFRTLLAGLITLSEGLNAEYIASQTHVHTRRQDLKRAILRASERYQQGGEALVEDVEEILHGALASRAQVLSPGTFLSDPKALSFLDSRVPAYPIGIKELDRAGIGATPKEMLLYIGPKGTGKTHFCVHMGIQGLKHKAKVLHITLEVREEVIYGRYCQALFNGAYESSYEVMKLEYDELERLIDWRRKVKRPRFNFTDVSIRAKLRGRMQQWGIRLGRILVKEFPAGTLTISQLIAFLDYLEEAEGYIPNMLIIDYPDLMKLNQAYIRQDLIRTFVELRGVLSSRNLAGIMPTQAGRAALGASRVTSKNVTEAIDKVFTADNVLAYSQTKDEERLGFGRLSVEHARNVRGGLDILLSQAYAVGQYVVESALLTRDYWDRLKLERGPNEEQEQEELD